jgi:signal-transduction protein with cAMP-binding, CBS, and nucleotidyltransferase domain
MRVGEVCIHDVATCVRSAHLRELAKVMRDRHVGNVVVVEPLDGEVLPVGIVTDRDLVVRVIAAGCDADAHTAGEVMHTPVTSVLESESVHDAIERMGRLGVSRLPVVDHRGHLRGIITANDIVALLGSEIGEIGRISPQRTEREQAGTPAPGPCHWPPRQ